MESLNETKQQFFRTSTLTIGSTKRGTLLGFLFYFHAITEEGVIV